MRDGFIFVIILIIALAMCSPKGCEEADAVSIEIAS